MFFVDFVIILLYSIKPLITKDLNTTEQKEQNFTV